MADGLTLSGLRDAYAAASPARKLVWGVVILLRLALPAMLFWQDSRPPEPYRVLYAKLSDKDGGEVVDGDKRNENQTICMDARQFIDRLGHRACRLRPCSYAYDCSN